jgi:hypothetical protein
LGSGSVRSEPAVAALASVAEHRKAETCLLGSMSRHWASASRASQSSQSSRSSAECRLLCRSTDHWPLLLDSARSPVLGLGPTLPWLQRLGSVPESVLASVSPVSCAIHVSSRPNESGVSGCRNFSTLYWILFCIFFCGGVGVWCAVRDAASVRIEGCR